MYFKTVLNRVYIHSKLLLQIHKTGKYYYIPKVNIFTRDRTVCDAKLFLPTPKQQESKAIQSKYDYARRLLIDNVMKRVTNSLAADLRRRSVKHLFNGNPSPFFALIGISLASGTGIITKENEFEGICWEIRVNICQN